MKRLLGMAASLTILALGTGCPPTYPKCDSDTQCKEKGEVCVQGQCQECAVDAQCKPGFVCSGNKCMPTPECTSDTACGTGKKCQNGKCAVDPNYKAEGACKTSDDCTGGQECQAGRCAAKAEAKCDWSPVRFDFNESRLTSDAQSRLQAIADCIKKGKTKVTLEGHADERGTEEYNLQLSNRRAESVKKYLATLGVGNALLEATGFGENRPAMQGASEEAWAANRRVEFSRK